MLLIPFFNIYLGVGGINPPMPPRPSVPPALIHDVVNFVLNALMPLILEIVVS